MNRIPCLCLSALVVGVLAGSGCSHIAASRTLPDGSVLKATSMRCLWKSEGIAVSTEDEQLETLVVASNAPPRKFKFTLSIQRSNSDAEAMGAIAEGAARGAAQSLAPTGGK